MQRELHTLAPCSDCGSVHLGAPCGMTWAQRIGTVKPATEWMPAKQESRAKGESKTWYDDEETKQLFGYDRKERKEKFMDDTKGYGALTKDSSDQHLETLLGPAIDE